MSGNCLFPDSARFFSLSYLYLVFRHSETFPFVYLPHTYVVAPQTFACLNYRNPISLTEFSVADTYLLISSYHGLPSSSRFLPLVPRYVL